MHGRIDRSSVLPKASAKLVFMTLPQRLGFGNHLQLLLFFNIF
jgi:hypothetical protein